MIVRQFISWIRTAPAGERAEATRALARAWLISDLTEDDSIQLGLPESGATLPEGHTGSGVGQAYTSDLRSVAFSVNWS